MSRPPAIRLPTVRRPTTRAPTIRALGYVGYVAVMSAGYYYNLTFVQLGLIDLGERRVRLPGEQVSAAMAALALLALTVAVATGRLMDRRAWSTDLTVKLRLLFGVTVVQTVLTAAAPLVTTRDAFVALVLVCSLTIGTGIPVTFSLMADLIPVPHRGHVAAAVAAISFAAAAVYPLQWRIEAFAPVMVAAMVPAALLLGALVLRPPAFLSVLGSQHRELGPGRFATDPSSTSNAALWSLITLMFAVFFIDSLGFLRIIDTPAYVGASWQAPDPATRLFIAGSHVAGALMAGVLYTAFGRRWLLLWIFGLFAFTHLLYTTHLRTAPGGMDPPLVLPLFYVLAVSFYTTLNFALWPDLSTARTLGTRCALGVGVAGWSASFLSTALALSSEAAGISLLQHLTYVNALALLLAAGYPVALYVGRVRALARRADVA
jgi:MFS family permease